MKGHEQYERILATYRDASPAEQALADRHVQACPGCAARAAAYAEVDAVLAGHPAPALPPRLARPLAAVVAHAAAPGAGRGFGLSVRAFAPAGILLVLVAAFAVFFWSVNSGHPPVTSTPTLTSTLTPTTVSARETEPVDLVAASARLAHAGSVLAPATLVPTPAPAPAPGRVVFQPVGPVAPVLLVDDHARAKMIY